jgi:hypothetical protein
MVYKQKHIDPPMSLLDTRLRQGGQYVQYYFDMDGTSSTVFPIFTAPGADIFMRLMSAPFILSSIFCLLSSIFYLLSSVFRLLVIPAQNQSSLVPRQSSIASPARRI